MTSIEAEAISQRITDFIMENREQHRDLKESLSKVTENCITKEGCDACKKNDLMKSKLFWAIVIVLLGSNGASLVTALKALGVLS